MSALQQRYNVQTGAAAEEQWCNELTRLGAVAWRVNAGTSARWNTDIFACFDCIGLTAGDVLFCQIKATAREPWPPAPIWRARFLALPHPPGIKYLLCWLTPDNPATWRVWRLLSDGTRLELAWPPAGVTA